MNLLDVNVLLALLWPSSPDFDVADAWFRANSRQHWATCALTQSGFIRISSQSSFKHSGRSLDEIAIGLEMATTNPRHRFLSVDVSFKTVREICTGGLVGHQARFVTFDSGVRQLLATEKERRDHLVILES